MDPSKLPILSKTPNCIKPGQTLHIGVTGHRDIRHCDLLSPRLEATLEFLCQSLRPGRIVLHTPLAMGADQLMLKAFQQFSENSTTQTKILAVLPMSPTVYASENAQDFEHCGLNLNELLDQCDGEPVNVQEKSFPGNPKPTNPEQQNPYTRLVPYMRQNCHIVFALWDGLRNGMPGGTGDVVEKLLEPSSPDGRLKKILWLSCSRDSNPYPIVEPLTWTELGDIGKRVVGGAENSRRRRWRIAGDVALSFSFLGFVSIGTFGYWELNQNSGLSAFFSALAHFTLGSEFNDRGDALSWWLVSSRFLAVLCVLLTAGKVLDKIFHLYDWADLTCTRWRKHDLVFGIGRRGLDLLSDCHLKRHPVIAVDPKPEEKVLETCEGMGIPISKQTFDAPQLPKFLEMKNTQSIFICTGSDLVNMRIANRLATHHAEENPSETLRCSVGLTNPSNFEILAMALPENHQLDIRLLNRESITCRALLREACLDRFLDSPNKRGAQAVIVGEGKLADELLKQIIQLGHFEYLKPPEADGLPEIDKKLSITRICENAEEACRAFRDTFPCFELQPPHFQEKGFCAQPSDVWLEERVLPKIRFLELPQSSRGRQDLMLGDHFDYDQWSTTVFVCHPEPVESSRLAVDLARPLEMIRGEARAVHMKDICVWYYSPDMRRELQQELERSIDRTFTQLPVRSFADFLGPCNRDCALGEHVDAIARRLNGVYNNVKDLSDIATLELEWRSCSEHDKDSSRQAAEHALVKHRIRNRNTHLGEEALSTCLAQVEHRRWCCDLLMKGFQPLTRIPSEHPGFQGANKTEIEIIERWFDDPDQTLKNEMKLAHHHIDLMPWDDLKPMLDQKHANNEKGKDYNQIQQLDQILFGGTLPITSAP